MGCLLYLSLALSTACSPGLLPIQPLSSPEPTKAPIPGVPPATPLGQLPEAEVQFQVQVPDNTPPGETIYLSVRDEVTGLALNAQLFEMKPAETRNGKPASFYFVKLPFTAGSAVRYRYERQAGGSRVAEHVADGSAVRYRLFHVDGPGQVQDVISRWTDTPFDQPAGRIQGQAFDTETEQPIPNLLVTAGGQQTITTSDGSFLFEGLPEGVHTLVALAMDGAYTTFQQGARVAAESTTPARLGLRPAQKVSVSFVARLPAGTPPIVPVRLAGSLYQLGNTFAELSGGVSSLATNMPVLSSLPDGRYSLTMDLPVGADIRYKYTLGDGFWNAEHALDGRFRVRQVVVPDHNTLVEDEVDTWLASPNGGSLTFDVTSIPQLPAGEAVSIQLNPVFGWTEAIPMWPLGNGRWAYILYGPLNLPGDLHYRYCRNGQCDQAAEAGQAGSNPAGRPATPKTEPQLFKDQVEAWAWYQPGQDVSASQEGVTRRAEGFLAGVELRPDYHPSWRALLPNTLNDVKSLNGNWLALAPTWTFTQQNPPVLKQVTGQDATWLDLTATADQARIHQLLPALFPAPRFPTSAAAWWQGATRDFSWWLVWFDHYRTFAIHHADLATQTQAGWLILGGSWLDPALPGGKLADGSPSGVPLDAEARWRGLIGEIRSHYGGKLLWALPVSEAGTPPPFLDAVDGVYALWSEDLTIVQERSAESLQAEAGRILDERLLPLAQGTGKPVILALAYASTPGALAGCVPGAEGCTEALAAIGKLDGSLGVDLAEQASGYEALLRAASERDWIGGVVSRGYYPPVELQDPSASVHGKPAGGLVQAWFGGWLGR